MLKVKLKVRLWATKCWSFPWRFNAGPKCKGVPKRVKFIAVLSADSAFLPPPSRYLKRRDPEEETAKVSACKVATQDSPSEGGLLGGEGRGGPASRNPPSPGLPSPSRPLETYHNQASEGAAEALNNGMRSRRRRRRLRAKSLQPAQSLATSPATPEPWIGAIPLEETHRSAPTPADA